MAIIEEAVKLECQEDHLIAEDIEGKSCLFLTPLQRAEVGVASHLLRLLRGALPWGSIDPAKALPWVEQRTSRTLSPSQREAVALALRSKVTVSPVGLGSAKSSRVFCLDPPGQEARTCLLCAPTGRAAKRLRETRPGSQNHPSAAGV
jgi:exodeoxyribonuclease V alpha subunit